MRKTALMSAVVPVLYESYTQGEDYVIEFYGTRHEGMTFTVQAGQAHRLVKLWMRLGRTGSPGNLTVGIRATSGGLPTGSDLITVTVDANGFVLGDQGPEVVWLGAGIDLAASTTYAIRLRAADAAGPTNAVRWGCHITAPGYTGGSRVFSDDNVNWTAHAYDFIFGEYGL